MDPNDPQIGNEIRKVIDKVTARFLKELPERVNKLLEGVVCGILGIEKFCGDLHIKDHRHALIQQHIRTITLGQTGKTLDGIVVEAMAKYSADPSFRQAMVDYTIQQYRYNLESSLRTAMEAKAKADCEAFITSMGDIFLRPLIDNIELADPTSFAGDTGAVVLEGLVEREIGPLFAKSGNH